MLTYFNYDKERKLKLILLYQRILLLISISLVLNFIPNIIFPGLSIIRYAGITFLLLVYIFLRGYKLILKTALGFIFTQYTFNKIALPLTILFSFEMLRYPINGGYSVFLFLILPFLIPAFLLFLIDIYVNYCDSKFDQFLCKYVKPYFLLCNSIVLISVLTFFLLKLGVINAESWHNVGIYGIDFQQRQEQSSGQYYSNPFYLTVILSSYIKVKNFFGEFGSFAGWSYEPHIACFFLTPACLMISYYIKSGWKKIALITSYVIFYILAFSIATAGGFALVLLFFILQLLSKNFTKFIMLLSVLALVIALSQLLFSNELNDMYNYAFGKTVTDNESSISAIETYKYLFSPHSIMGNGLFVPPVIQDETDFSGAQRVLKADDVGIIPFILFFWLYFTVLWLAIKKIFAKTNLAFIGLIMIYLIFHSLKFPFHVLGYPFIYFFFFILSVQNNKHIKIV